MEDLVNPELVATICSCLVSVVSVVVAIVVGIKKIAASDKSTEKRIKTIVEENGKLLEELRVSNENTLKVLELTEKEQKKRLGIKDNE